MSSKETRSGYRQSDWIPLQLPEMLSMSNVTLLIIYMSYWTASSIEDVAFKTTPSLLPSSHDAKCHCSYPLRE